MSPRRLVVVDDEPSVGAIFRRLFRPPEYEVAFFDDADQALARLRAGPPPDLVVLDINMPGINGFEACRRLKSDEATAQVPVAMFTEWDRVMDIATGLQAGADYFFSKDIAEERLCYRVEDIFRTRAQDGPSWSPVDGDLDLAQPGDIFRALEETFNGVVQATVVRSLGSPAAQLVFSRALRHVSREHPILADVLRDSLWLDFGRLAAPQRETHRRDIVRGFATFVGELLRLLQKLTGSDFVSELQAQMEKKLVRPLKEPVDSHANPAGGR